MLPEFVLRLSAYEDQNQLSNQNQNQKSEIKIIRNWIVIRVELLQTLSYQPMNLQGQSYIKQEVKIGKRGSVISSVPGERMPSML